MSSARRVIGVEHIASAHARGLLSVETLPTDIITDLARESADRLGIELLTESAVATVVPQVDSATSLQRQLLRRSPRWSATELHNTINAAQIQKLAIVGVGGVGSTIAQLVAGEELAKHISLIDIAPGLAEATALDLRHASGISGSRCTLDGSDKLTLIKDATVVVVTAGKPRTTGMTRSDLISINRRVIETTAEAIRNLAPLAVVIVVTNPLDEMTLAMLKATGFERERVLGMAGTLDSSRFRVALAGATNCDARDVQAFTLGSHGDEMVPLTSSAKIKGVPVDRILSPEALSQCVYDAVHGGGAVVKLRKTGSAAIAPAYAVTEVLNHMRGAKSGWVPVSLMLQGEYGLTDVVMGLPANLSLQGLSSVEEIPLSDTERDALQAAFSSSRKNQLSVNG